MREKSTALLVIDVQESFKHRPYYSDADAPAFFDRLQALCDGAKERGIPIVRVLHVEDEGVFSEDSGFVRPMPEVRYTHDFEVKKRMHSALAGSALSAWLAGRGISRLIVSGIRTEQCCETTTRHASDSGFSVDYVSEATLTFPLQDRKGRLFTANELRERTEAVLHDRFARVCTVEEALRG